MEQEFLQWLKSKATHSDNVLIGMGDDAALVKTGPESLICSDMIAEGTHFTASSQEEFHLAGRKSLAINLSDIAAMGGIPKFATLSLLLPKENGLNIAKWITEGFLELAKEFSVTLIGGDTCSWNGGAVIDVSVIGEPSASGKVLKRSGARVGEYIFCTGQLGGSLAGHHSKFQPRCQEIQKLVERYSINCCTDVSDGLVIDLNSILTASSKSDSSSSPDSQQLGAKLAGKSIPVSTAAMTSDLPSISISEMDSLPDGLANALYDGEDFELLFTVSAEVAEQISFDLQSKQLELGCRLTMIGRITNEPGISLQNDETSISLPIKGFEH